MMAAAVDIHSGDIHYEYYINSLMVSRHEVDWMENWFNWRFHLFDRLMFECAEYHVEAFALKLISIMVSIQWWDAPAVWLLPPIACENQWMDY